MKKLLAIAVLALGLGGCASACHDHNIFEKCGMYCTEPGNKAQCDCSAKCPCQAKHATPKP